jgi:transglutaminase-like putative cysteine protease
MSRTWLSVITAAGILAASVTILLIRRNALGPEIAGPLGWRVNLLVEGTLLTKQASVSIYRPLDFRRQHITEERFQSGKELREQLFGKRSSPRKRTWRRPVDSGQPTPFRLEYSFVSSRQGPTPTMERVTAAIDKSPASGVYLQSTSHVQVQDQQINRAARAQAPDELSPREQAKALWEFVAELAERSTPEAQTALDCLQQGGGTTLGKTRLLTALCRSRGVPTRMLTGLVLTDGTHREAHYWAEAWIDKHWLPMDPVRGHFGQEAFPENYLAFRLCAAPVVVGRGAEFQFAFVVQGPDAEADGNFAPSAAKNFWRKLSFYSLHVSEQRVVEFLLLLPLGALIVSIARTLIGIRTFGIFAPALIGLAFLDLSALPWALPIFLLTVLVGWGIRHALERYSLLQVPRVSVMITFIVIFLLAMIVVANNFGVTTTRYVSLFPLVILTFMVERFWTIEAEDSTAESFKTLLGTIIVAVLVSFALGPPAVRTWMFRYPETLGAVLAALFLLGRYTGYRLTELYRFEDLIREHPTSEGTP